MRKLAFLVLALPAFAAADLHYWMRPDIPSKAIRVAVRIDDAKATEELRIPAWTPGFYFLLDYQKKITAVRATDVSGKELVVKRKEGDSRAWIVANPAEGPVTLSYTVVGDDGGLGFFGVSVKDHAVFVNGAAAFMYSVGRLQERTLLKIALPENWKIATGMSQGENGWYTAGGYDELIDHPLQLGVFESRRFTVAGVPFEAVFVAPSPGGQAADLDSETENLRKLSVSAIKLFGSFPSKKYVFIIHLARGSFSGGLEHRASTVMSISNTKPLGIELLASHEYFHTWNVKQIRPKPLGPFDYAQPARTRNLWFAEGVTDYYANIMAYRSGLIDQDRLLRSLGDEIDGLQSSKVRKEKTLEDASWYAWENGGFGIGDLSYYTKGLVAGLLLDAAIRSSTQGEKSLDDVMRLLYSRHALPKPGYEEDEILTAINEVAGADLSRLYTRIVRSTDEAPYDVLGGLGLEIKLDKGRNRLTVNAMAGTVERARLREWLAR